MRFLDALAQALALTMIMWLPLFMWWVATVGTKKKKK